MKTTTTKTEKAIANLEATIRFQFNHRRSMEREYASEPKHKLESRRFAARSEREDLRTLCESLRGLRQLQALRAIL